MGKMKVRTLILALSNVSESLLIVGRRVQIKNEARGRAGGWADIIYNKYPILGKSKGSGGTKDGL